MWRTCWDFRSQFWASSGHSSRLPLKPRFRAIQRYKNYPLRAKIEVQRFSRPFCGSVGAKCASAHMMRSNTKIQINSANSDLILQAHSVCQSLTLALALTHHHHTLPTHTAWRCCCRCRWALLDRDVSAAVSVQYKYKGSGALKM